MRLVFLDLDSVVNSERYFARRLALNAAADRMSDADGLRPGSETYGVPLSSLRGTVPHADEIDPEAVARLVRVVEEGRAKVVISSSWRVMTPLPEIDAALRHRGFRGEIVGVTPRLDCPIVERGREVQAYLSDMVSPPESFVILEDAEDMLHLTERTVRTTWEEGMQDGHVDEALRILAQSWTNAASKE